MTTFNVDINVYELVPAEALHINVDPEMVPLQGQPGDTILWTIKTAGTAKFVADTDIQFKTAGGRERFRITFISPTQILGTVQGSNENQTVYTYYLTVHLLNPEVAIRIDPEVDNPPPPPG